jgi:two-component system, chemotaxis family, sensor histidine kinase and response regulator WspE
LAGAIGELFGQRTIIQYDRAEVVAVSQDISQLSLSDLFCMEVTQQMAVYNHALLSLETSQDNTQALQDLMRAAHSIKGAARIVQAHVVVAIAHDLEDYFVAAQAGEVVPTEEHVDVLLMGADLILELAQGIEQGRALPDCSDERIATYLKVVRSLLTTPLSAIPIEMRLQTPVSPQEITDPASIATFFETLEPAASIEVLAQEALPPSVTEPPMPPMLGEETRSLRVNRDSLQRLMDLAGESLVSANYLQHFSDDFLKLKKRQLELTQLLEQVQAQVTDVRLQEKLTTARQKANECNQGLLTRHTELESFTRKSSQLADRFYREVLSSQMRPFGEIGQGFPRMVRDLARQLGRQVKLEILGTSTLVDRDILDRLETPLVHLLRNAIDHGIEPAAQRQLVGKPAVGRIQVEAKHRAGLLFITVQDDGRGVNVESLRRSIVMKGLATPPMVAQMDEAEVLSFLYLPGFSTAQQVTEISGRGVGLDIVHNMLQNVGGTIHTTTKAGQGTTFHLQLPVTLSVLRSLLVEIQGDPYALPLSRVDSIFRVDRDQIQCSENRPYVFHNRQAVSLISAAQVLGLSFEDGTKSQQLTVVVIQDAQKRSHGLVVDRVLGEQSLVLRSIDKRLGKVPNFSNAALLNDGSPLLVVDMDDLLRGLEKQLQAGQFASMQGTDRQTPAAVVKRILVVDDSITVREMERKLLENAGYQVEVAVNGVDGWNALQAKTFDLLVTDIDMPRMNGIELVRLVRGQAATEKLPTIIVSYKDRESDRLQGLEVGANYYLTKSSFHDDSLLQAVVDLIGLAVE